MNMAENKPTCGECKSPLDPGRVLDHEIEEHRVAAGTDAEAAFSLVTVSCPGCFSMVRIQNFTFTWSPSETVAKGTEATRLAERLRGARERGALEREVHSILATPRSSSALLLAAPEVLAEWLAHVVRRYELAVAANAWKERRPELAEPFSDRIPVRLLRAFTRPPSVAKPDLELPAGAAFTLSGVFRGELLLKTPEGTDVTAAVDLLRAAS